MQFSGFQRICATVQTSPQPTSECDCHSEKASSPLPSRLGSWTSHRPWTARCALAVSASVPTWGYFLVTFTAAVIKKNLCKNNLMKEENVYYFLSNLSIFLRILCTSALFTWMGDEGLFLLTVGAVHYQRGSRGQELETVLKASIFRKKRVMSAAT